MSGAATSDVPEQPRLAEEYRKIVEGGTENFYGLTIVKHAREIGALMTRHWAQTAIDIGCGRGDQYKKPYLLQKHWGLREVTLYDPAFAEHSQLPDRDKRFDAVLCSDVLEHIPEEELDQFIGELFKRAEKFVWASVCCRKAKKRFEDGTNMHVTVRPIHWWLSRFTAIGHAVCMNRFGTEDGIEWHLVETP